MTHRYYPTLDEFHSLCERGNVVPVYRQLMADTLTPVLAFQKIASGPHAFLLESASGSEERDRYSFLGSSPFALFRCRAQEVTVAEDGEGRTWTAEHPLGELEKYLRKFTFAPLPGLPRFTCGAVGYMAYDVVRFVEHLPDCPPDDRG
ncbi:MAG: anthranilate synthase component I, partial [Planctomycetota bacterium]